MDILQSQDSVARTNTDSQADSASPFFLDAYARRGSDLTSNSVMSNDIKLVSQTDDPKPASVQTQPVTSTLAKPLTADRPLTPEDQIKVIMQQWRL